MNTTMRLWAPAAALASVSSIAAALTAYPAFAAGGDVEVVNTETVQVYTDATGDVRSSRIYEQVALTGNGTVDLTNPVVVDGLRNLDGFGGFKTKGDEQVVNLSVDGEENLRSVSDYEGDLPLEVVVQYRLDGEEVDPQDVVGASGDLEVTYTIRNVTREMQTLTFPDGKGGTVSQEAEVMLPLVGSLTTELPGSFRDVEAPGANLAGNGKGGTRLSYTMTLLAPVGSDTATFGYSAEVVDGLVPDTSISVLPVDPFDTPSFASAGESYQAGAATGAELTQGATQIDQNLLKLRDGAADLLAGLLQLRDGADQLKQGLTEDAVPGAGLLSDGAAELRQGLGRLEQGAGRLADGTRRVADGAEEVEDGAGKVAGGSRQLSVGSREAARGGRELTRGLSRISEGLDQLAGVEGLPAAQEGVVQLQDGVDTILEGFGDAGDPESLIGGLTELDAGLVQLSAGSGELVTGLTTLRDGLGSAKGGVDAVRQGLAAAIEQAGGAGELVAALRGVANSNPACSADPACQQTLLTIAQQVEGLLGQLGGLGTAVQGLGEVSDGLGGAIAELTEPAGRIMAGALAIQAGLTDAKAGSTRLLGGAQLLRGGVQDVRAGLDQLGVGLASAVDGVLQLNSGAGDAVTGSGELAAGLGEIADGAGDLADGAGTLAEGSGELSDGAGDLADGAGELADGTAEAYDGSGQLADGAGDLAEGLVGAADGSELLANGVGEAADGAPQLRDGAQRLSDEGTSKLVDAGEATAQEYGAMYAALEAGAERARESKMVVGAPEGALGLAAYSFEIQGEDGEGGRNVARGIAGLAIMAAGAGVFALRRRLL